MNRWVLALLTFALPTALTTKTFALGSDFSPQQIAAAGKYCVHGFWVNEQTVTFHAGNVAQLNLDLPNLLEGQYASRKVVIHVGTKQAQSPWDKQPREIHADWSINSWDDPDDAAKAVPRMRMQVDVWLGSKIKLDDLRVPEGFEVVSGGEIDKFIEQRKAAVK